LIRVKSLRELAFRHLGPVSLALVLAAISIVPVAWTLLDLNPGLWYWSYLEYPARTPQQAFLLATCAVVPAGLLGGFLGGLVRGRRPVAGAFVAMAVSWPVGITMLPLAATVLGIPMRDAIFCFDTCTPQLVSGEPFSGMHAYAYWAFSGIYMVVPVGLALLVAVIAWQLARRGSSTLGSAFVVLAYVSMHALFLLNRQAWIPFACLALGVIAWTAWLDARGRHLVASSGAAKRTDVVHLSPPTAAQPGRP
jgi:hypothetical protein